MFLEGLRRQKRTTAADPYVAEVVCVGRIEHVVQRTVHQGAPRGWLKPAERIVLLTSGEWDEVIYTCGSNNSGERRLRAEDGGGVWARLGVTVACRDAASLTEELRKHVDWELNPDFIKRHDRNVRLNQRRKFSRTNEDGRKLKKAHFCWFERSKKKHGEVQI